jgi:hypothetical protein
MGLVFTLSRRRVILTEVLHFLSFLRRSTYLYIDQGHFLPHTFKFIHELSYHFDAGWTSWYSSRNCTKNWFLLATVRNGNIIVPEEFYLLGYNAVKSFKPAWIRWQTGPLPAAYFMTLRLILDPEDAGDTFPQMSVDFQQNTRRYIQEDRTHHELQILNTRPNTGRYIKVCVLSKWSQDGYIGIVKGWTLGFWTEARDFSFLHSIQTDSAAHPSSYPVAIEGSFLRYKPGGAWSSSLTSM